MLYGGSRSRIHKKLKTKYLTPNKTINDEANNMFKVLTNNKVITGRKHF